MNALKEWLDENLAPVTAIKMLRLIAEPTPELVEKVAREFAAEDCGRQFPCDCCDITDGCRWSVQKTLAALASALPGMAQKEGGK